jgi:tripartite-type tricarboxylate transporter receptor subunit TctC
MRKISTASALIGRRSLLLSSAATVAAPAIVRAEAPWPAKPIRIIVPFGPGGSTDISMRILAPKLSEMLGQTCVVENRAGAGGVVGTDIVTKSAPDGYTLGHCTVSQVVIAPALYERLPFAPEKDLTPISPTVFVPMCLSVTRKGLKVNSVQELVAEMRANPGKLSYASNGIGATSHLAGATCCASPVARPSTFRTRAAPRPSRRWSMATCNGPSTCRCCTVRTIVTATCASSWPRPTASR